MRKIIVAEFITPDGVVEAPPVAMKPSSSPQLADEIQLSEVGKYKVDKLFGANAFLCLALSPEGTMPL
jgi:hypothetical protein